MRDLMFLKYNILFQNVLKKGMCKNISQAPLWCLRLFIARIIMFKICLPNRGKRFSCNKKEKEISLLKYGVES